MGRAVIGSDNREVNTIRLKEFQRNSGGSSGPSDPMSEPREAEDRNYEKVFFNISAPGFIHWFAMP